MYDYDILYCVQQGRCNVSRVISNEEYLREESDVVISESGQREPKEEWDYEPVIEDDFGDELVVKSQEVISVSPSRFVEFAVTVPDKVKQIRVPFSFVNRRYLSLPYDTPSKRVLLKCGRQVEKSTLLGNKSLAYCALISSFNVLYVSPTNLQTKTFSQDRLKEPIETSSRLKAWTTTQLSDNIFLKKFVNRSQLTLRYAYHNADRVRGIPADLILVDEVQDIITDNLPVIEECASHSIYKLFLYSGTPKSLDNPLEKYWTEQSTQNEWVVPCEHHGVPGDPSTWHWNILGEGNIGLGGLVCSKCGKPIVAMHPHAQWASMNPSVFGRLKQPFEGYRIPQLMVPWLDWHELLDKRTKQSPTVFNNEVLGLSYDSGNRPLTRQDIIANCSPGLLMTESNLIKIKQHLGTASPIFAGIDWGCHDEQTRILTLRGFVYFKDLTSEDQVAQWDPETRNMSFVVPLVRTVRDWNKPLLHFKTKAGLDLMVTDTHRMRTSGTGRDQWVVESAEKTAARGGSVNFVGSVSWEGTPRETFTLPGVPKSSGYSGSEDLTYKMEDWLEFLGYLITEGGLCYDGDRPSCLKMSQRETVNYETYLKIQNCLDRLAIPSMSIFPNEKTGDVNWTIYGKQFWQWYGDNVGTSSENKRIPREFLSLPEAQLRVLFQALVDGDGYTDPREGCTGGAFYSTSKGLCEDFQELCVRLGLRCVVRLHKPAEGNRQTRWRAMWSEGRDYHLNTPSTSVEHVPYSGKVYCCAVPTGFIVTERNGCVAYQGNTGENAYTVLSLGAYINEFFTIFFVHRFEGPETEPQVQLDLIETLINNWNVKVVGTDYGGGFDRNDHLQRKFGRERIWKYQYSQPSQKVKWEEKFHRFLIHRTEVMSDVFNAIKRKDVFRFLDWSQFEDPFSKDFLNIFSEYNEQTRQIQYKKSPDCTDDAFHSILLCFMVSMLKHPRFDVLNPQARTSSNYTED